uniref:C2H2-type domain-containing protein n=1 Tax=Angiostrongylus cantonensis TaxID=6313 RepID=A0A0K0D1Y7_ANGCA
MRTTLTTAQSVYGSQRPTFSDDGTGIPYSSSLNIARPSLTNQEISTHTNSKDPVMVRSRVFIGRIANAPITRDDLITLVKPFGNVLGLNHFKMFISWKLKQRRRTNNGTEFLFGHGTSTENRNVHFEVKEDSPTDFYLSNIRKRNDENDHSDTRCSKLSRMDISPLEEIRLQNRFNRTIALGDYTTVDMISAEMADTLICGTCRYVTSDYESFKDHRIAGCNKRKDEEEPEYLKCISCGGRFRSAWALLHHLTEFHRMVLFKVEEEQKPQSVKDEVSLLNTYSFFDELTRG